MIALKKLFKQANAPDDVARYYDKHTSDYQAVGGTVIQSFRPSDTEQLLRYLLETIGLQNGMKVLDAGCGIAGPAAFFASQLDLEVEGLTISPVQQSESKQVLAATKLRGTVNVKVGDYHELDKIYARNTFDVAIFLESLGHAAQPDRVIESAFNVLKPGGSVFIKDFFPRVASSRQDERSIAARIENINRNYCYNTLDLSETIQSLRRTGFAIEYIRSPGFTPDLKYVFEFEKRSLTNCATVPSVDWFEIKSHKEPTRNGA